MATIFRDFLYLDTDRLQNFVSQMSGGLVSKINETIRNQGVVTGDFKLGIPTLGGGIGGTKESGQERQQIIELTHPAYFEALYQHLKAESAIATISTSDLRLRQKLEQGQFIEMLGFAEPPAVEDWVARVKTLIDFIDRNFKMIPQAQTRGQGRSSQLSRKQLDQFKGMFQFLEDYIKISRKDPGKQFIRINSDSAAYNVWCGLAPMYISAPLENTLPAQIRLVGRIEHKLSENEVYRIVDFTKLGQSSDVSQLLVALNGLGPIIGQKTIEETDLQAQHPDIFVTPLAIYR